MRTPEHSVGPAHRLTQFDGIDRVMVCVKCIFIRIVDIFVTNKKRRVGTLSQSYNDYEKSTKRVLINRNKNVKTQSNVQFALSISLKSTSIPFLNVSLVKKP